MLQEELADSHQRQWDLLRDYLESYAEHRPVRSVAVIGNKPLQPDAERAAAIDSSDLVLRVNSFQLDEPGEPPTLGTACHVALISRRVRTTKWVFRDYRRRGYLVPQMGFPLLRGVRLNPLFWPPDLGAMPLPNGVVMKRLADRLDPGHAPGRLIPTSGTTLAYLAHEMFPGAAMLGDRLLLHDRDRADRVGPSQRRDHDGAPVPRPEPGGRAAAVLGGRRQHPVLRLSCYD